MLDGRMLNHQLPRSTVRPSRRSWRASWYRAATASITAAGSATTVLISPGVGVALEVGTKVGEPPARLREHLEHDQGGDATRVGSVVVPEVVVARMLAAEEGVGVGHDGLDVGVADTGADRHTAALTDDLRHRLRADQVVQDGGAGVLFQHGGGHEGGGGRTRDRDAQVIDQEAPVGVAVERQPHVGAGLADAALQIDQVGWLDGVGGMVGKGAI